MFGFRHMDEDPFFASHREQMRMMQQQMFQFPFGNDPYMALTDGTGAGGVAQGRPSQRHRHANNNNQQIQPFGMFTGFNMFSNMQNMMTNMQTQMSQMSNNPNCHSYTSSTVMSYSNTGDGQPKYYQASSSERRGPGGIKETRRAVRDSEQGLERMAIGHHIGERGHVVDRKRNTKTGERDETQDYINLEENEVSGFDREWREKSSAFQRAAVRDRDRRSEHRRHHHHERKAIASPEYRDRK